MLDNKRIEILQNDKWVESIDIRAEDTFRLFNSDGSRFIDSKGRKVWVAATEIFNKFGDSVVNVY